MAHTRNDRQDPDARRARRYEKQARRAQARGRFDEAERLRGRAAALRNRTGIGYAIAVNALTVFS